MTKSKLKAVVEATNDEMRHLVAKLNQAADRATVRRLFHKDVFEIHGTPISGDEIAKLREELGLQKARHKR